MTRQTQMLIALLNLVTILFVFPCYSQSHLKEDLKSFNLNSSKNITIGIIKDGPGGMYEDFSEQVKKDLLELAAIINFKELPIPATPWDLESIEILIQRALKDKSIDAIFTSCGLSSVQALKSHQNSSKPIVTMLLIKKDIFDELELKEPFNSKNTFRDSHSTNNVSIVISPESVKEELQAFQGITNFKKLHILIDINSLKAFKELPLVFQNIAKDQDYTLEVLTYTDIESLKASINDDIEAVYSLLTLRTTKEERSKIYKALSKKGIPTFSFLGSSDVKAGALATLSPNLLSRMSRRVAFNLYRSIMFNKKPSMSSMMLEEDLLINGSTLKEINLSPPLKILQPARIINIQDLEKGNPLTLKKVVEMARNNNVEIANK
ncbi:MAG: hypothetical protein QNJ31_06145 [Candidatus Caenarcaniphilales bacterium]|nr:hypothetical protein [Candidatus Caenarcaniphilales bacterium]